MNPARKMRLYVSLWYVFWLVNANDENITEWNSTTIASTPLLVVNLTSEWLNSTTVSTTTLEPLYNETDASNFIATDYTNNSTYLEHFTKFNWTVLDTFDNSFGGTDDIGVKHDVNENITDNTNSSRVGYERNLMVVLPVMQGNSELSNSNLQILYTQPPITAIIGEEQEEERRQETSQTRTTPQARTTIKMMENRVSEAPYNNLERIDHDEVADKGQDNKRHHYMEFLHNKPVSKPKSPLDYGYPETFKFIEDFNELPKNHRPDWAIPDVGSTRETKKSTTYGVTKRDPFQMFESVKPLEINKLLAFKPIPVTDSLADETTHKKKHQFLDLSTDLPLRPISKRPNKRPSKKPQKNKITVLPKFATGPSTISSPSIEEMYAAANSMSQTTAAFLPTPWREPASERTVETTTPRIMPTEPPTTLSMIAETTKEVPTTTTPTPSTTTAPTTTPMTTQSTTIQTTTTSTTTEATTQLSSTTQAVPNSTVFSTTECSTDHKKHQLKPSDLINLKKILDNEFGNLAKSTTESIKMKETSNSPLDEDMLTSDMRNMLIALGLLRSDGQIREQTFTTTTTTTSNYLQEMFMKREPATPNIDPHSYVSFKKIPSDFGRQSEKLPVSDEMKDLLASFGLLPRNPYRNSLTRMARQHKIIKIDYSPENSTSGNVSEPIENFDVLTPQPFNYQPHENGHVFHPTVHLETLGDEKKLEKINHVIDTIKNLSKNDNATIEEIEEQLENITSVINDENVSNDPFLSEVTNMIARTKAKIKSFDNNATIDLKTNSDFYKPDESSIVLNTYSGSDNGTNPKLSDGPSPLSSEELQQLFEFNKNDVKRQQPSNNTSGSAPLPELAASFGGGETASEEPAPEDLPTAKPNGLYFFVDWNTFLNVGESDKNPIRVRFAPRAGNPRNFVPITLP